MWSGVYANDLVLALNMSVSEGVDVLENRTTYDTCAYFCHDQTLLRSITCTVVIENWDSQDGAIGRPEMAAHAQVPARLNTSSAVCTVQNDIQ